MSSFESRLKISSEDFEDTQNRLELCEKLGIKNIIVEPKDNIKRFSFKFRNRLENATSINIFYRINLKINDVEEFKKQMKNYNKFYDIISVESLNKDIQLRAARDSRVDIVSFSDQEILKALTPGVISLTKQNNSFIEFSLAPIMIQNKVSQSKSFRSLYRFIQLALKLKANYIISGNFNKLFDFRHPRALISICHTLLGMPFDLAKKAFTANPKLLIERTQKRHRNDFESGARIITGGI